MILLKAYLLKVMTKGEGVKNLKTLNDPLVVIKIDGRVATNVLF